MTIFFTKDFVYKPLTFEKTDQTTPSLAKEPPAAETEEKQPLLEFLKSPVSKKAAPEKRLPLRESIDAKRLTLAQGPVTINVEKMPLSDFIIYALGETLKVSFVMDQKVMDNKEPITFSMTQAMPSDKALEIVLGLFEKYNLQVEEKSGALYILHKSPEPKQPFDIRFGRDIPESPAPILQVVPLRHIKPHEIAPLVNELYKATGVQVRFHPKGENVILLYGQASQLKQLMEFIEAFDVPYMENKKIMMFKLTYWQIDDFVKQISQILSGIGLLIAKSPNEPGIFFVPINTLKAVLVITADDKSLNYVLEWKEKLDTPEAAGTEERPYIFIPRYSKASDLVNSIKSLYGVMTAPKVAPTTLSTPQTVSTAPTKPPAQTQTQSISAIASLKISSDDNRNIIMILSSPVEYKNILNLLKELDVPPRQVLIEATVAELTLTGELKYGIEWYIKDNMLKGASTKGTYTGLTTFGLPEGPGFVWKFATDTQNFNTLINAFASEDKVNLLSTPRLIVLDNQEATIQVGTDIPIVTGEVTASDVTQTQPSILRNIQYRKTGVLLRVKPNINTEGLLTLNISLEVSEMGTNPPGIDSPTILTRTISTTVVAAHGHTIALGGLMSESEGRVVTKVPLLGDIPLIGELFKTTSKERKKTELLILLTPSILNTIDDSTKITNELKKELKWLK